MLGLECNAYRLSQANQLSQSGATFKELCVTDAAFEIQVEWVANGWLSGLKEDEIIATLSHQTPFLWRSQFRHDETIFKHSKH